MVPEQDDPSLTEAANAAARLNEASRRSAEIMEKLRATTEKIDALSAEIAREFPTRN
jgi:hypothetical protein